jgi:hypothetical protein
MGHQELAMIDEAASVGTSPWPLSVLLGGLVDPSRLPESSLVRAERSGRLVAYGVADLEVEELLGVGEAQLARIGGRPDREGGAR